MTKKIPDTLSTLTLNATNAESPQSLETAFRVGNSQNGTTATSANKNINSNSSLKSTNLPSTINTSKIGSPKTKSANTSGENSKEAHPKESPVPP